MTDYNIRQVVAEIRELNDDQHAISIEGDFIPEWRLAKINININFKNFGKRSYEFLLTEMTNILVHEIEHADNTNRNPLITPSVQQSNGASNSLMECVYEKREYLLNPSEINAYIREFMTRAKYTGALLEDILEELIRNEILKCNSLEIQNHINQRTEIGREIETIIAQINATYQNRINQIYSNRRSRNQ